MKKISIIVPVYNTKEKYLKKCLDSLISQTIQPQIEIIIVDDGSKKDIAELCDAYAQKYEYIKVIHQNNQGLAMSRNNGMKQAKGEWIMFVDSDDWVEKDICEKLLKEAKEDVDIIISSCNNCYMDLIKPVKMFEGQNMEWSDNREVLELQIISKFVLREKSHNAPYVSVAWAKLYRIKFLEQNNLENICKLRFREDNIFNLYCFEKSRKIVYRDYYLYNYRQCENSLIHRSDWNMIELYIEYLEEIKKFIKKYNKSIKFYEAYKIRNIQSIVNIIGQYIFRNKCRHKEKIKKIKEIMKHENFIDAVYNVDISYLSKYLKLMVFLLKKQMYITINVVYNIRAWIKEKDEQNLYD